MYIETLFRSEGSLNQHSKLKHPNLQPNQL